MNKKIIIVCAVIVLVIVFGSIYIVSNKSTETDGTSYTTKQAQVSKQTIVETLTNSSQVSSGLTEKIELHATYYFKQLCAEKNSYVEEGENLLEYTNGTYLKAPYNLVITGYLVPLEDEQITNSHYIQVQTTETLCMNFTVTESNMDIAKLGQEVEVIVNAFETTPYKGIITSIDETGTYSSGKSTFNVIVTFMNDGNIKLGMSGYCTIVVQEEKDVLAVPVEAVEEKNNQKYVVVVNEDGSTTEKTVEIGISNAKYVQIKSGLTEGETVQYIDTATGNTATSSNPSSNNGSQSQSAMELVRAFN